MIVLPTDISERNKNVFVNIEEVEDSVITEINEPEVKGSLET